MKLKWDDTEIAASARFEAGLVGVGKTADISGVVLESMGEQVDLLSRRIPVATEEAYWRIHLL